MKMQNFLRFIKSKAPTSFKEWCIFFTNEKIFPINFFDSFLGWLFTKEKSKFSHLPEFEQTNFLLKIFFYYQTCSKNKKKEEKKIANTLETTFNVI